MSVGFERMPGSSGRLSLRPAACPSGGAGGLPLNECSWFEVQTLDGAWHNATSVALNQDSTALLLTVYTNLKANATRAFYSAWPVAVLFSEEGLPVMPWWDSVDA